MAVVFALSNSIFKQQCIKWIIDKMDDDSLTGWQLRSLFRIAERRDQLLGCLLLVMLSGCSVDQHDHPELTSGQQLFDFHCAPCHKKDGTGIFLKGVPPNRDTDLSVWEIIHKTEKGSGDNSKMPRFQSMPDEEAAKIAIYLKQLGSMKTPAK